MDTLEEEEYEEGDNAEEGAENAGNAEEEEEEWGKAAKETASTYNTTGADGGKGDKGGGGKGDKGGGGKGDDGGAFTYDSGFGVRLPITHDVVREHLLKHLPLITSTYHRVRPPDAFMHALVRGVSIKRAHRGRVVSTCHSFTRWFIHSFIWLARARL